MAGEKLKMRTEAEIRQRLEATAIAVARSRNAVIDGMSHPLFPRNGEFSGSMSSLLMAIARKQGFLQALKWVMGSKEPMDDPALGEREMTEGFQAVADLMRKHVQLAHEDDAKRQKGQG